MLKLLILAMSFVTFSAVAADRNSEFERKAILLGDLAFGAEAIQLKPGTTAQDMVIELAMEDRGESREEILETLSLDSDGSDVDFGDQIGWGTLTLSGAQKVYGNDDDSEEAQRKRKAKSTLGTQLIRELSRMGAKFGFTDGSSTYCGVSFVGLLVIDEKTGRVYEIALTGSGEC